ncbi:hypothetical protein LGH83_12445 [Lichenihabitans sp. PAMC28606]|uniref:hypothetical protein n=1 Tax=Lichenihabitans sp. PAMC28606 TaxID=2880932 RepID=UPI001D0B7EE0|nr:hypothetical protein [Lichenihabitans sp. PAMC28606]UDL93395.1 hypothetical protein LGH83_12445 [Lichenihabitans sp. PAMC28606]
MARLLSSKGAPIRFRTVAYRSGTLVVDQPEVARGVPAQILAACSNRGLDVGPGRSRSIKKVIDYDLFGFKLSIRRQEKP